MTVTAPLPPTCSKMTVPPATSPLRTTTAYSESLSEPVGVYLATVLKLTLVTTSGFAKFASFVKAASHPVGEAAAVVTQHPASAMSWKARRETMVDDENTQRVVESSVDRRSEAKGRGSGLEYYVEPAGERLIYKLATNSSPDSSYPNAAKASQSPRVRPRRAISQHRRNVLMPRVPEESLA